MAIFKKKNRDTNSNLGSTLDGSTGSLTGPAAAANNHPHSSSRPSLHSSLASSQGAGANSFGGASTGSRVQSGIPLPSSSHGASSEGVPPYGAAAPPSTTFDQQQAQLGHQAPAPTTTTSSRPQSTTSRSTSGKVLYPWSQRRLHLLPVSRLADPSPSAAGGPGGAVAPTTAWSPGVSPGVFPRYGHSVNPVASSASGDVYVFGGLVHDAVKNDLYVLSCEPNASQSVASAVQHGATQPPLHGALTAGMLETRGEVPGPRVGHASVGVGNVLIVWGGDTKVRPDDTQDDGLYLLNLTTREWTCVQTVGPRPEGRYGHTLAIVGSKLFVFGGQKDDGSFMNDLAWFDLARLMSGTPRWHFIQCHDGVAPPRRTGHTSITHGESIYIFGGTDGQYHYNDTWAFNTTTETWEELSCIGYIPVPREGHAATLVDDVMYVFGGRGVDGNDLDDLAAFKITTRRWFMFQNMGPSPSGRSGHVMATWQSKVLVLGGESYTSPRHDDPTLVHVLDTAKIKYPQDSSRLSIARKSSMPVMEQAPLSPPPGAEPPQRVTSPSNGAPRAAAAAQAAAPMQAQSLSGALAAPTSNGAASLLAEEAPPSMAGSSPRDPAPVNGTFPDTAPRSLSPPTMLTAQNQPFVSPRDNPPLQEGYSPRDPAALERFDQPAAAAPISSSSSDAWHATALALARSQGFLSQDDGDAIDERLDVGRENSERRVVFEALLHMRRELANAKGSIADQAQAFDEQMAAAAKGRSAAIKEAAFYRAKLAALEGGNTGEAHKLDRERIDDLERRLGEALNARASVEREASEARAMVDSHTREREDAERRQLATEERASAAETSYARSLAELAELQRKLHQHEGSSRSLTDELGQLRAFKQQHESRGVDYDTRLRENESQIRQLMEGLEETEAALSAAHARNGEVHEIWQTTQAELADVSARNAQLQTELNACQAELQATSAKAGNLERVLASSTKEHDAMRMLATGQLAEVLRSRSQAGSALSMSRDLDSSIGAGNNTMAELAEYKDRCARLTTELEKIASDLNESRMRESTLSNDLIKIRRDLTIVTKRQQQSRSTSRSGSVDDQVGELTRAKDAAEAKVEVLRGILAEHGLYSDEQRSQSADQDLRQRLQEAEADVERLKASSRADEELQRLRHDHDKVKSRYTQLEQTHLKAVQYVKGTERLLVKMKSELTKYKSRNEELEKSADRGLKEGLESMKAEVAQVREAADASAVENRALSAKMDELRASYEDRLSRSERSAQGALEDLRKTQSELDETLVVNASLNDELKSALKNSGSRAAGGEQGSEPGLAALEHELSQAKNRSEWLKMENTQLEQRCRAAEEKIAALLDQMEDVVGKQDDVDDDTPQPSAEVAPVDTTRSPTSSP